VTAFVDTSVLLRFVLEGDIALHQAFAAPVTACSELLWIESMRATQRLRLDGKLSDNDLAEAVSRVIAAYASMRVYLLDREVRLAAAGPFPTVIGTLDAFHLSSAMAAAKDHPGEALLVYSYDRQMNVCARAMGFLTPLTEA
jgi:hypothetical protein